MLINSLEYHIESQFQISRRSSNFKMPQLFENIGSTLEQTIASAGTYISTTIAPAVVSAVTGGSIAFWIMVNKDKEKPTAKPGVSLKLEAQKISAFSGDYGDWARWKSRTECAFDGSGYEKVLSDEEYAVDNPRLNKIVYSQLSVATVDGNAHHLVKKHERTKNGHECWQSLLTWYDGDTVRNETSEDIRGKIENLSLHPGVTASAYVNKFLTYFRELESIPGEGYSPSHAVYLFLGNISHPDYEITVAYLRNTTSNLEACITSLRKAERDIMKKNANKRRMKATIRRWKEEEGLNVDEQEQPKKKKARRFKGEVEPNEHGFIKVSNENWKTMESDQKRFVQSYNAKIKHKENLNTLQTPPDMIIKCTPRRLGKENQLEAGLDAGDPKAVKEEDQSSKGSGRAKKRISFPLEMDDQE